MAVRSTVIGSGPLVRLFLHLPNKRFHSEGFVDVFNSETI